MAYHYIEIRALELMQAFSRHATGKPATTADALELMLDVGLAFKADSECNMVHALASKVETNPVLVLPAGRHVEYLADELDVSLNTAFEKISQRVPGASHAMLIDLSDASSAKLQKLGEFSQHYAGTHYTKGLSVWGRYLSGVSSYLHSEMPADRSCDFLELHDAARNGPQRHLFVKRSDVMVRRGIRGFNF